MAKSYHEIQIKCDDCGNVVHHPIEYNDGWDKWNRLNEPDPRVILDERYQEWEISNSPNGRDYCPTCRVLRATEERTNSETKEGPAEDAAEEPVQNL